jgi:hypothetical protein
MPPRSNQNLATWLMMIPLLVVPAVAIFGVPQFSRLSAQAESAPASEPQPSLGSSGTADLGSGFAPISTEHVTPPPERDIFSGPSAGITDDPFHNPKVLDTPRAELDDAPRFADTPAAGRNSELEDAPRFDAPPASDPFAEFNGTHPNRSPRSGNPESRPRESEGYVRPGSPDVSVREAPPLSPEVQLSWRRAIARLNELGVSQYSLEPSSEPYLFRFTCDFTPEDNPRLTHRFEAEASEPLRAVQKAIVQVETWLSERSQP